MRIIAGSLKGRKFNPQSGFKGRPTTDYARESLFNILRHRVDLSGANVLDLFGGTGAMSYEAASQGAQSVTSVEKNNHNCRFIRKTLEEFGISNGVVICSDVFLFLKNGGRKYDLIIADPPFDLDRLSELPSLVRKSGVLADDGLFVLEHGPDLNFDEEEGFDEDRRYGHVHFSFFTFGEA